MFAVKLSLYNEKIMNVENTGYLASREGSARDVGQNASNTGCTYYTGRLTSIESVLSPCRALLYTLILGRIQAYFVDFYFAIVLKSYFLRAHDANVNI